MTAPQRQTGTAPQMPAPLPLTEFERLLKGDIKSKVEFQPFGAEGKIVLSVEIIRKYIAAPAFKDNGEEILPDDRQCMKFLMLCRSRALNPFESDSFMIPFFNKTTRRHEWSLITAHQAFLKRAEISPAYDGKQSGVIITPVTCKPCDGRGRIGEAVCSFCEGKGYIDELEGDFVPQEINGQPVELVGGWCKVYVKERKKPEYQRLKLETYRKGFGVWMNDPAGMICKCSEAAALRSAFPTILGGMMLREEMQEAELAASGFAAPAMAPKPSKVVRNNLFQVAGVADKQPDPDAGDSTKPVAEIVSDVMRGVTGKTAAVAEKTPQATSDPPPASTQNRRFLKAVRTLCKAGGIAEGKLLEYCSGLGVTDGSLSTLEEFSDEQLQRIHDDWATVAREIKKHLAQTANTSEERELL